MALITSDETLSGACCGICAWIHVVAVKALVTLRLCHITKQRVAAFGRRRKTSIRAGGAVITGILNEAREAFVALILGDPTKKWRT